MSGSDPEGSGLTREHVWRSLSKATFAILGFITPRGQPRSSGVVYGVLGGRIYVAVAPDSWKAKHIAARPEVSLTVPVRRGGLLSLVIPIPPATISFHGSARVLSSESEEFDALVSRLGSLLPAERRSAAVLIEILPQGDFVTYGIGVPLLKMRDPASARGRAQV